MALAHVRDAPQPLPPDVPPVVAGLVMQMLVKDPAARFANGATLAQAVGQVRAGPAGGSRTGGPVLARTAVVPVATVAGPPMPSARFRVPAPAPVARAMPMSPAVPNSRSPASGARPDQVAAGPSAYRPQAGANRTGQFAARPTSRHTGLSVLLALLVLVLAGITAVVINTATATERSAGTAVPDGLLRLDAETPGIAATVDSPTIAGWFQLPNAGLSPAVTGSGGQA
jgi:serine/threonine-protein kinase